jgi:hypothetical protein
MNLIFGEHCKDAVTAILAPAGRATNSRHSLQSLERLNTTLLHRLDAIGPKRKALYNSIAVNHFRPREILTAEAGAGVNWAMPFNALKLKAAAR